MSDEEEKTTLTESYKFTYELTDDDRKIIKILVSVISEALAELKEEIKKKSGD